MFSATEHMTGATVLAFDSKLSSYIIKFYYVTSNFRSADVIIIL